MRLGTDGRVTLHGMYCTSRSGLGPVAFMQVMWLGHCCKLLTAGSVLRYDWAPSGWPVFSKFRRSVAGVSKGSLEQKARKSGISFDSHFSSRAETSWYLLSAGSGYAMLYIYHRNVPAPTKLPWLLQALLTVLSHRH